MVQNAREPLTDYRRCPISCPPGPVSQTVARSMRCFKYHVIDKLPKLVAVPMTAPVKGCRTPAVTRWLGRHRTAGVGQPFTIRENPLRTSQRDRNLHPGRGERRAGQQDQSRAGRTQAEESRHFKIVPASPKAGAEKSHPFLFGSAAAAGSEAENQGNGDEDQKSRRENPGKNGPNQSAFEGSGTSPYGDG